ncbi:small glutamine-rich tetratricopeptide repeat-containing protein alpha-like [Argiope bruennichi]|uniref:small glutamine-rich tetratricopeptide repeat-containing protein alpha-like n=1 Tax=Argiope bruennichi TaxID=94029 RepID=UPI002494DFFD|nr:small glutamine-rich tetratricopeptide repeat-containing protein alpha-like [Argiope bruennichi]
MRYRNESENVKNLAITIADFLSSQSACKFDPSFTRKLRIAVNCLEKVYSINLRDYLRMREFPSLPEIFQRASHPVPIKDKLQAEKCKIQGNALIQQGKYSMAEIEFTKAICLNEQNPVYYCNRADTRIKQGQYQKAAADCHRALSLDPQYSKAYAILGQAYFMMNLPAKAARCYRKALKIQPHNEIYLRILSHITQPTNGCGFEIFNPFLRLKRNIADLASNISPLRNAIGCSYRPLTKDSPHSKSRTILSLSESTD